MSKRSRTDEMSRLEFGRQTMATFISASQNVADELYSVLCCAPAETNSLRSVTVVVNHLCIPAARLLLQLLLRLLPGASIPMGQGGHVPPLLGPGGHDHECPPQYF